MASTKPSAFTADATPDDADIIPFVDLDGGGAGVHLNKKITFSELTAYFEGRNRVSNASIANQTFSTTDAYVVGSDCLIPVIRLQQRSEYRFRMQLQKTSTTSSTATPIVTVRYGTNGSTADTARCVLTFPAQTAVADDGFIDVFVTFRQVGASAVLSATGVLDHRLASTGLCNTNTGLAKAVSGAFDSFVAGSKIGVSFNGGASFAGNTDLVQAELMNLA